MSVLYILIPFSIVLGIGFLGAFIWSVMDGQMEDTTTPAHRILDDNEEI